jgi:L-lactate dehydrogenase complex protein LldE
MIRHYYAELFRDDPELAERASRFAAKTYEFSQFLVQVLGVEDLGVRFPERVTYHASCHGSRLLGIRDEPLRLLSGIDEMDFVPLRRCEDCCGFGGTFSVKLADVSAAMVDEKLDQIVETGADYVVSTDLGCLMNIAGRCERRKLPIQTLHLAELLDRGQSEKKP